ncbi:MAG: InlB B-repeat-containing protein, partial [Methanomassiliicoccaceae archaeon]|nr:InlB B-repeat-containing protein [Methanomassiliicoccaceae archaeon]
VVAVLCGAAVAMSGGDGGGDGGGDSGPSSAGGGTQYTIATTRDAGGSVSGAGTYSAGSTVNLTATPDYGYSFNGWYKNGVLHSSSSSLSFKAQESLTLNAKFSPLSHTVTVSINNASAGTLSTGGGKAAHGSSFTCSVTQKAAGYAFDGWFSGATLVSKTQSYTFTVSADIALEARYSVLHDASFTTSMSTDSAPTIITMTSLYNIEVAYRTWTVTDTITGKTVKFEDGINGGGSSTFVRIDTGMGVDVTQTITYADGGRASKTSNVVVNENKAATFNWKYHEDYVGAWWNPFDHSDLDPTSMNRDASVSLNMTFAWYYKYASDPIVRGYQPPYLTSFVNCNDPVIKAIANEFKNRTSGWSDIDRANYVLHFVQSIPYKYDKDGDATTEHWNYPSETLWRNQGDCEDHAILYAALMKELGYRAVLFWVNADGAGHLAVGLDVEGGSGTYYNYLNGKYYYCETTPGLLQSYWFNVGYKPANFNVTAIYPV